MLSLRNDKHREESFLLSTLITTGLRKMAKVELRYSEGSGIRTEEPDPSEYLRMTRQLVTT
jgi:hypothetical protein